MLSREARHGERLPRPAARPLKRATLALVLLAAFAAGCGGDDGPAAGDATTELELAVSATGKPGDPAEAMVASVRCPGDEPEVCDAVAALPEDPGAPIDPATPCTEIYGGPDALLVTGTLRGEPIEATFSRENGCEIERFDRWSELLAVLFPSYRPGSALEP